jgi:YD repeat-containing protein
MSTTKISTQQYFIENIGDGIPTSDNSANFNNCAVWNGATGNVTSVGTNGGSSYYLTYDQSGNVYEWNDLNNSISSLRGIRGGSWSNSALIISSVSRFTDSASNFANNLGFRIASYNNENNIQNLVEVSNINNDPNNDGYGSIGYVYYIGKYAVTNTEYCEFLNAIAKTDSYGVYSTSMGSNIRGGILRSNNSGNYTYTVKNYMGNKPVNYINWFDSARYCNWLHNNKPSGSQNNITTEDGSYTLNGITSGDVVIKNLNSKYHIPTEDEWYKAAYFDPHKLGTNQSGYWLYATQNSNEPLCVNAITSPTPAFVHFIKRDEYYNNFKINNS